MFLLCSCLKKEEQNFIYIAARNSMSKEGDIVLKYNSFSQNISHIGIALDQSTDSKVWNVSYDEKDSRGSSLLSETFSEFFTSPKKEDNQIWKIPVTKKEHKKIEKFLKETEKKKIHFDFDESTDNGYYCSEFVFNALQSSGNKKFEFSKKCAPTTGIARAIIGAKELCYLPADFFLTFHPEKINFSNQK